MLLVRANVAEIERNKLHRRIIPSKIKRKYAANSFTMNGEGAKLNIIFPKMAYLIKKTRKSIIKNGTNE
jgi:hypothetical protein